MIKKHTVIVSILASIICGVAALLLGKDINWDLRNYHYYNAYALLENRLAFDIAPAQLQTFFNPILDLPFFWMAQHLPAKVTGAILGALHGINLSLIFLIFCEITSFSRQTLKIVAGIAVIIISAASPGFIAELGGTMNDNLVSIFVSLAIFLILIAYKKCAQKKEQRETVLLIIMAGLIMGAGVGLKPTIAIYALSSAVALLVLFRTWQDRIPYFIYYSAAGIAGGVASSGFWWWRLWIEYGNPLLPFLNNIFQSKYIATLLFTDKTFLPVRIWEYFLWPIIFSLDSQRVSEVKFVDIRFAVLFFISVLTCGIWVVRKLKRENQHFESQTVKFLVIFFILSFILWMKSFSIYRYLISLELFAPIIFLALLERIVQSSKVRIYIIIAVTISLYALFSPLNLGRVSWSDPYINIKNSSSLKLLDNAVVVMLGFSPTAYVIPAFPSTARFIRPEGNLYLQNGNQFFQKIKTIIDREKKSGNLFILFDKYDPNVNLEMSSIRLGLDLHQIECSTIEIDRYEYLNLKLCRIPPQK